MSGKNPIPTRDGQIYEGVNVIVPVGGWQLVKSKRDPTSNDKKYPVGSLWVNTVLNNIWILTSAPGNWIQLISSGSFVLGVANGGTGDSTLTAHGVLVGEGTSPVAVTAAGTNGQILVAATGADPAFASLTSTGSTITVTGGANTLNIDVAAPLTVANGGTGRTTLTVHGVLIGETAAAINQTAAGTNGQVLLGSTGADPAFGTLTTTTGIAYTVGAAALAVDVKTGGFAVVDQTSGSANLAVQTMYVTDNGASLVTYTLPATAVQGSVIKVVGSSAGGWRVAQNANQQILMGASSTTLGVAGSLNSTNKNDCVELIASVGGASTIWTVASFSGTLTFV